MQLINPSLQLTLDLLGVFVFGLSGGLVAVQRHLDVVGVLVLAWVAGLGGGMIRDVLLGATPPVAITDWRLVAAAVAAGLIVFFRHPRMGRIRRLVRVLDACGLAVFAVSGALKAVDLHAPALAVVIVGAITAAGGGVVRDLLVGQVPDVLRRELYAVPALVGSALVLLADRTGYLNGLVVWLCAGCVFALRIVALRLHLQPPYPRSGDDR